MSLIDDVRASFEAKGMAFVSLEESGSDPEKSILTYIDGAGSKTTKEIGIRLSELEDTVATVDVIDPDDLANFLLGHRSE